MIRIFLALILFSGLYAETDNGTTALEQELSKLTGYVTEGDKNLIAAMSYELGNPDANIKSNIVKAYKFYIKSYKENHNPYAAYKLGLMVWNMKVDSRFQPKIRQEIEGNFGDILNPSVFFENGMKESKELRFKESSDLVGVVYGMYTFLGEKNPEKTIQILTSREAIEANSLAQLYIAFSYREIALKEMRQWNKWALHKNGKEPNPQIASNLADTYLTKACKNPKADWFVLDFCLSEAVEK